MINNDIKSRAPKEARLADSCVWRPTNQSTVLDSDQLVPRLTQSLTYFSLSLNLNAT